MFVCGVASRWCVSVVRGVGSYRSTATSFSFSRAPQSGLPDGAGVGRGGAGGVVQFLDVILDMPVVVH